MKTTRYRTADLVGDSVNFDASASPHLEMTIVIHIVSPVQAEEPIRSQAASARSVHLDRRDPYQVYRRVVVPTAELLREGLPEPEI